jgi:hypothetical protein
MVSGTQWAGGWMGTRVTKMNEKLCFHVCTAFWQILPYMSDFV